MLAAALAGATSAATAAEWVEQSDAVEWGIVVFHDDGSITVGREPCVAGTWRAERPEGRTTPAGEPQPRETQAVLAGPTEGW